MNSPHRAHAITGAFGFSGKYVARRLLDAGRRVVTLTNSPDRPNPFGNEVEARAYHFGNMDAMIQTLSDVEVLYNTYWVRFNHTLFKHSEAVRNTLDLFQAAHEAGVKRIVHVSITHADADSPLEYFSGKGQLEKALQASGLSHAILRPAVLFGPEDILINNIAWALRTFPVVPMFGNGQYHIQPIHVDDLARLMVEQGEGRENTLLNALGPEDYTYREILIMIGKAIGKTRPILGLPPWLAYMGAVFIGMLMGDTFITREEIRGLMADTLHVQGAEPTGTIRLSEWVREYAHSLGTSYHSEMARRTHRARPYESFIS